MFVYASRRDNACRGTPTLLLPDHLEAQHRFYAVDRPSHMERERGKRTARARVCIRMCTAQRISRMGVDVIGGTTGRLFCSCNEFASVIVLYEDAGTPEGVTFKLISRENTSPKIWYVSDVQRRSVQSLVFPSLPFHFYNRRTFICELANIFANLVARKSSDRRRKIIVS